MAEVEGRGRGLPEVLIVADDLTGAADSSLAFATRGFDTVVALGAPEGGSDAEVLAVDAATRAMSEQEATRATAQLIDRLAAPGTALFKKIDSTLRGHVGPEVAAALLACRRVFESALAVVTPAFPALGRTVRGGRLFLVGVPHDAGLGQGPSPSSPQPLPRLLVESGLRTASVGLDLLRLDSPARDAAVADRAGASDALACDAETEADLHSIVAAVRGLGRPILWAGSAGLAAPLAEALSGGRAPRARAPLPAVAEPVLFVVGSRSRESLDQVAALARQPGLHVVPASPAHTPDEVGARLAHLLACGDDVLLRTDAANGAADSPGQWSATLAGIVARHALRPGALVLTGGDTARAVLTALGVRSLKLAGEVAPGVALSVTEGTLQIPVITKAGAFGDRETLVRCRKALRREDRKGVTGASA